MEADLKAELASATAKLKEHIASWDYAFAMAAGHYGGRNHPRHSEARARAEQLTIRCRDLRAQVAEHEL
jgi:hypothetical protein